MPAVGTAKLTWPMKLQRRLNEAERTERGRWIAQLKRLLQDGGCPSVRNAASGYELSRRG